MSRIGPMAHVVWRKSSFSGGADRGGGDCVEAAALSDGWNSRAQQQTSRSRHGVFTRTEIRAWIKGVRAGEFDNLS